MALLVIFNNPKTNILRIGNAFQALSTIRSIIFQWTQAQQNQRRNNMQATTGSPTPIRTTGGQVGERVGNEITWANGDRTWVLDSFPPLKQGGKVIQESLLIGADEGHEELIFCEPTQRPAPSLNI